MSGMRKYWGHLVLEPRSASRNDFQRRHAHNYYVMGVRRAEDGAYEEARRLMLRALRYDPSLTVVLGALAQLELSQNNTARAHDYAERLVALRPRDAASYMLLGNIALSARDPEQALLAFTRAKTLGEEAPELTFNTGLAHLLLGQGEAAAQIFGVVVAEQPENPRAWDALGCARRILHDHPGAIQAFLQALKLDPQLNDTRDHLAQLLLETGKVQYARQILEAALSIEPERPSSLHLLGVAHARQNEYAQAIRCWETILAQDDAPADTYQLLANAYLRLHDEAHARQILESLLTLFPEHAAGHIQLALLLFGSGETAAARRHLEQARQLDPQNPALAAAEALAMERPGP